MPIPAAAKSSKRYVAAFALTASLVALWGLGHRLHDTLMPLFAEVFHLEGMRLGLTQSIYNFVYIFTAIPAALYARRFGFKAAILLGLGFAAVGAFTLYPASETQAFPFYVTAMLFMAQGWLVLEIAANPLFVAFGSRERAVFRLNLAQCLYPIGAFLGICAGFWLRDEDLAVPSAGYSYSIAHPYILIGACVLILAFLVEETEFPESAKERIPGLRGFKDELNMLLAKPLIRFAMLAQMVGIIAGGLLWFWAADVLRTGVPGLLQADRRFLLLAFVILQGIGRFAATALMYRQLPAKVLLLFAGAGCLLALLGMCPNPWLALSGAIGLVSVLSITWPTILGLAIQDLGQEMKLATALLALAGAIGALVPRWVGPLFRSWPAILQHGAIAVCCAVIAAFAYFALKRSQPSPAPEDETGCLAEKAN